MEKIPKATRKMSQQEISEAYEEILNSPLYVTELTDYECDKVLSYASDLFYVEWLYLHELEVINPEYPYPGEYLPNRKFLFWADSTHRLEGPSTVIKVIKDHQKSKIPIKLELSAKKQTGSRSFLDLLKNFSSEKSKKEFADAVKKEYKNCRNIKIRYMIEALRESNYFDYNGINGKSEIYNAIKEYFDWDIGALSNVFPASNRFYLLQRTAQIEHESKIILALILNTSN